MTKQSQSTIFIPPSLIPQFEAWGNLTIKLFGELRRQTGLKLPDVFDDQAWFHSTQWQKWEQQADEDIAAGRVKSFDSLNELFTDLDV